MSGAVVGPAAGELGPGGRGVKAGASRNRAPDPAARGELARACGAKAGAAIRGGVATAVLEAVCGPASGEGAEPAEAASTAVGTGAEAATGAAAWPVPRRAS